MGMSKSSSASRRVRAGVVVGATAAVLLGTITAPGFAATAVVVTPDHGPVGGGNTVDAVLTNYVSTFGTVAARFQTTADCGTFSTANTSSNIAATAATKVDANTVRVTVPATLTVGTTYRLCIYGAAANTVIAGTATAIGQDDYTVDPATPALNNTTGPAGGGNTITATATGPYLTGTFTPGVIFSVPACAATIPAADATHIAGTATKTDTVATITVPAGAVAPNTYNVCIYKGTATGSALIGDSSNDYTPGAPEVALSGVSGPNGGGNTLTVTSAAFADLGATMPAVNFSASDCSTTYEDSPANLAASATRNGSTISFTVPAGVLAPNRYHVCLYAGTTDETSPLMAVGSETYSITLPDVTTSPNVGASGVAKTITVTSASPILAGVTSPGATLSVGPCLSTYTVDSTHRAATNPKRITNNIASIGVPTTVVLANGAATTAYNVCLYNGTSGTSTLVANAGTYTVAGEVTLASDPIDLAGGPAQGGTLITVTGTGFPSGPGAITANLGGSPLENIKRVNDTTFTGVTTAHAAGPVALSVTTAAGTITRANAFVYSYGITVQPNTAPTDGVVDLYITGAGFSDLDFAEAGDASTNAEAHVYLVTGVYDPTDTGNNGKDNPPVAECEGAIVISDTALLCSLNLEESLDPLGVAEVDGSGDPVPVPDGTYTVTVTNTGLETAEAAALVPAVTISSSILTSGSTFTVAPY